ncbi:MAG: pyrroline-5-carboxylate reductase [Gammaproteobacteria bacterium]|nr:pyrroline-5-carboxylate reductase [Gammaproteobacteria bacterium]
MLLRRIGFIGFKRMGEAIAEGMRGGNFKLEHFLVCSPSLMNGRRSTPFPVADNNQAVAAWADFLVLATKPAQIKSVCEEIAPEIQAREQKPVLVSVAAGKLIKTMQEGLGCDDVPIVRAMTSTPSLVQKGMTVWYANDLVTPGQLLTVREAFASVGREMQVDSEEKLDMATAVSGSGPAYFFYVQECMIQSAMKLGFSREEAVVLVNQTALGSAELAAQSDLTPTELRENVTSPDGTTEEGLAALMDGRVAAAVDDCMQEAYKRSVAMGQGVLISPRKKLEGVASRNAWFTRPVDASSMDEEREARLAENETKAAGF